MLIGYNHDLPEKTVKTHILDVFLFEKINSKGEKYAIRLD